MIARRERHGRVWLDMGRGGLTGREVAFGTAVIAAGIVVVWFAILGAACLGSMLGGWL